MAQIPKDQERLLLPPTPRERRSVHDVVSEIVSYISEGIRLTLWLILAALVGCVAYVALKAMFFCAHIVLRAIGV